MWPAFDLKRPDERWPICIAAHPPLRWRESHL
jgi:hypothetical protein